MRNNLHSLPTKKFVEMLNYTERIVKEGLDAIYKIIFRECR